MTVDEEAIRRKVSEIQTAMIEMMGQLIEHGNSPQFRVAVTELRGTVEQLEEIANGKE